ncbi:MAG TPA: outer membrane protein assembly factor BamD [Candidatus Binatia bacterium]
MKTRFILPLFLIAWLCGCSSIPLPSMPSLPWTRAAKSDPTAEALFDEGMRSFNDKRYVRAIDNFSKLRTDFPFSPQIPQVELKIADAYYLNQQYPEAISAFKEYQSMHPTNENNPFVTLRLGQAHLDQFTSTDRDQKNTEIAKGYFETVLTNYPKSPQATEAQENLAKCLEYLAEHEFIAAYFYFQQEKYPAARDRFEEIVRKYKDTSTAVKSLFYLGESYRNEKNVIRATLAYEALIEHYPQSKFAAEARTQLAQIEKEKRDPLALLLMRDRRPAAAAAPEVKEDPALAKLKNANLIAKTEVVHEEPGDDKGLLRRVADKLNPFSSDSSAKKEEKKTESALDMLAKRNQAQKKEESGGLLASLWPFGGNDKKTSTASNDPKASNFVGQIDDSLKQKGIDTASRQASLKPPPADLPKTDDLNKAPAKTADTATLLSSIDANLQRSGKNGAELPPAPEAAAGFKDAAGAQAIIAKAAAENQQSKDVQSSGILSSIDQKLKAQGVEPEKFEKPPTAEEVKATATQKSQAKNVELEPKLSLEKGPLFLSPGEVESQEKPASNNVEAKKSDAIDGPQELPSRVLVKGPVQTQTNAAGAKPAEKQASAGGDDQPKGVADQIRQDMESVGKVLNPFRW